MPVTRLCQTKPEQTIFRRLSPLPRHKLADSPRLQERWNGARSAAEQRIGRKRHEAPVLCPSMESARKPASRRSHGQCEHSDRSTPERGATG